MRLFAALMVAFLFTASAARHAHGASAKLFDAPFGRAKAVASPDGKYALWGDYLKSQLWMEDRSTGADRLVGSYTVQTISVAWSPDSRHFVVNDRETSTASEAYLFSRDTLQRANLGDRLTAKFPAATHYLVGDQAGPERGWVSHGREVMHAYVEVPRWIDDQHVELQLHGNFAGKFRNNNPEGHLYPAGCFDLRFRVGLDGSMQKLSQRVTEPLSENPACGWGPMETGR